MKKPPRVIKIYPSLPRNPSYPLQEFRLRIVKYFNSETLLDLREFVTSDTFTGYSPKGVALNSEQVWYLFSNLLDIIGVMIHERNTHVSTQVQRHPKEVKNEGSTDRGSTSSEEKVVQDNPDAEGL